MELRCPQCQSTVEINAESSDENLCCPSCGSTFSRSQSTISLNRDAEDFEATYIPDPQNSQATIYPIVGDYEILDEIAQGGMGVVYKARQKSLNRIVALKMIRSGELANQKEINRFRAEAEAVAHLDHLGIVPIYEVGEYAGEYFLSMAFLDGGSLSDRLKNGPLRPLEAAVTTKLVTEAVQYAHDRGVIHRDLKPQNILLDQQGNPKVTDFGLAKNLNADSELTIPGQIMGTPAYMAPEQARGMECGPLADVYAIGATLYCLLTGRPPFKSATPHEIIQMVIEEQPVSPRTRVRTIPADLETICLKCLRKDPTQRYASAQGVADDLGRFLNHEPILARPVSHVEKIWLWCRRRPGMAASLAMIVTVLAISLLLLFRLQSSEEASDSLKAQLAWKSYLEQNMRLDRIATMARNGDYQEAVKQARTIRDHDKLTPLMIYDLGCVFSLASGAAKGDTEFPYDTREKSRREYMEEAVKALQLARRLQFFETQENRALLTYDPDLAPIRSETWFRKLIEEVHHESIND